MEYGLNFNSPRPSQKALSEHLRGGNIHGLLGGPVLLDHSLVQSVVAVVTIYHTRVQRLKLHKQGDKTLECAWMFELSCNQANLSSQRAHI